MASKTRSMRVLEADIAPIQLLGHLKGLPPAEVLHDAVTEYLARHGEEFRQRFATAQKLIRTGNVAGLAELLVDESHSELVRSKAEEHLASLQ